MTNRRKCLKNKTQSSGSNGGSKKIELEEVETDPAMMDSKISGQDKRDTDMVDTGHQEKVLVPTQADTDSDMVETGYQKKVPVHTQADTDADVQNIKANQEGAEEDQKCFAQEVEIGLSPGRHVDSKSNENVCQANQPDKEIDEALKNDENLVTEIITIKTEDTFKAVEEVEVHQISESNPKDTAEEMRMHNSAEQAKETLNTKKTVATVEAHSPLLNNISSENSISESSIETKPRVDVEAERLSESIKEIVGNESVKTMEADVLETAEQIQDEGKDAMTDVDFGVSGPQGSAVGDGPSGADDVTDSQLCAMEWSSQFQPENVPSACGQSLTFKTKVSSTKTGNQSVTFKTEVPNTKTGNQEDGTAVVVMLIKELQQLNKSLVKTRREMEDVRRQKLH